MSTEAGTGVVVKLTSFSLTETELTEWQLIISASFLCFECLRDFVSWARYILLQSARFFKPLH